ncbi:MAG: HEAT repeat domain-containing protein [Thermoleophilia bacterium]
MSTRHGDALPPDVAAVLREFVNAMGKAGMYPAGHRFVEDALTRLADVLGVTLETRGSLTLGFTPRSVLLDGTAVEPLPMQVRQLGQRLHRKNIGTIQIAPGVSRAEVSSLLEAISDPDAEEVVGRAGLRLAHLRVEPLVYDVLQIGGQGVDELDEVFWSRLVEAAFGQRLSDGSAVPTAVQLAEQINERASATPEGARRVFEALASFATALHARRDRAPVSARRRFIDVLSALSRPTTTRVMGAAPTKAARRRFMRETLEQVPPSLLLQLLESVAEADDEPISAHLRLMLGKLAGGDGVDRAAAEGDFATEVMGLLEQWDGEAPDAMVGDDPRLAVEPFRVLALGLELGTTPVSVLAAARRFADQGHVAEALQMLDQPGNSAEVRRAVADAVLEVGLLERLLADAEPDWSLVERVARHTGTGAVATLLQAISAAEERVTRRRILDLLVAVGAEPGAEAELLDALEGAPWHLMRNILTVLSLLPSVSRVDRVLPLLDDPEFRVRLEAMKVLVRQPASRERAVAAGLEDGDPQLARLALASLDGTCPPTLVASVISALGIEDEDVQLQAIRLVSSSDNPLVIPSLLELVRTRGGLLRRWRLRAATPTMLSALTALAGRWANHRPVMLTMQMAARSPDPVVRAAIGMGP